MLHEVNVLMYNFPHFLYFKLIFVNIPSCITTPLIFLLLHICSPPLKPLPSKKKIEIKIEKKNSCHGIFLAMETVVCQMAVIANKSLVRFEASGFWYTINTGTPLGHPVSALSHGSLWFGSAGLTPLHNPANGVDVGMWMFPPRAEPGGKPS